MRHRLGLFGGTFDPIHVGHLALARAALDALALDELRLIPTGRSWQKAQAGASAEQRVQMARLAVADDPRFVVDDREARRPGLTYTVDTLRELRGEVGAECALVLLLGSDQLHNLPTWEGWESLLDYAHLAVTQRERIALAGFPAAVEALLARHGRDALPDAPFGSVVFFGMPPVPVSATALRRQLASGQMPLELVPPAVLDYIRSHHLYR
jgi:nicotinate-nucleotide adenylyltransferase